MVRSYLHTGKARATLSAYAGRRPTVRIDSKSDEIHLSQSPLLAITYSNDQFSRGLESHTRTDSLLVCRTTHGMEMVISISHALWHIASFLVRNATSSLSPCLAFYPAFHVTPPEWANECLRKPVILELFRETRSLEIMFVDLESPSLPHLNWKSVGQHTLGVVSQKLTCGSTVVST